MITAPSALAGLFACALSAMSPDYPDALLVDLASSKIRAGDYQGALEECTAALASPLPAKLEKKELSALASCAIAKRELKDLAGAMGHVQTALGGLAMEERRYAFFEYLKGLLQLEQGDAKTAVRTFTAVVMKESVFLLRPVILKRAIAEEAIGDLEGAAKDYDLASSGPDGPEAQRRKQAMLDRKHASEPVIDADGRSYPTLAVGDQVWMLEDLAATHLNDGASASGPRLYDWRSVNSTRLCPKGWRVPYEEDWKVLAGKLGLQVRRLSSPEPVAKSAPPAGEEVARRIAASFPPRPEQPYWSASLCGNGMTALVFYFNGDSLRTDCVFWEKAERYPVRCVKGDPKGGPVRGTTKAEWTAANEKAIEAWTPQSGPKAFPKGWPGYLETPAELIHGYYWDHASLSCDVMADKSREKRKDAEFQVACSDSSKAGAVGVDERGRSYVLVGGRARQCNVTRIVKSTVAEAFTLETSCGFSLVAESSTKATLVEGNRRLDRISGEPASPQRFKRRR